MTTKIRTIKITVSRTIQVERFEPAQVTVEESIQVLDEPERVEKARASLYSAVTKQVKSYIENEKLKYAPAKKRRSDDDE